MTKAQLNREDDKTLKDVLREIHEESGNLYGCLDRRDLEQIREKAEYLHFTFNELTEDLTFVEPEFSQNILSVNQAYKLLMRDLYNPEFDGNFTKRYLTNLTDRVQVLIDNC